MFACFAEMSTEPSSKTTDIPMDHPVQSSPQTNGVNIQQSSLSYGFQGTSAAELLLNIVSASQAGQQNSKKMEDEPFSNLSMGNNGGTTMAFTSVGEGEGPCLVVPEKHNYNDHGNEGNAQGVNSLQTNMCPGLSVSVNNSEIILVKADGTQETGPFLNGNNNMLPFEGRAARGQVSPEMNIDKSHILQNLLQHSLVLQQQHGSISASRPGCPRSQSSASPYTDSNMSPYDISQHNILETEGSQMRPLGELVIQTEMTQATLIRGTDGLRLDSFNADNNAENDIKPKFEWASDDFGNKSRKVARLNSDCDASSALSPSVDRIFNPESANQEVPSDFTFTKFGMKGEELNMLAFSNDNNKSDPQLLHRVVDKGTFKKPSLVHDKKRGEYRRLKEPILCQTFPTKAHGCELKITEQPEEQHRARYLTEGSRGAVKGRNGSGFPEVKLFGYSGQATLQIFIGNDSGKVRPHGFYQACKVSGKNSTQCSEKEIEGTNVIEIDLSPSTDMSATVDCVGILKLRNADVEQRIGQVKAKKKSTKARMIFRVTFQKSQGNAQILQVPSHTILCTQPIGQPEICKMSMRSSHVSGGEECYIIGKNFLRGTQVFFQLVDNKSDLVWSAEGAIDKDYFQATHLIVTVPRCDVDLASVSDAHFQVVINSSGKVSEPMDFQYTTDEDPVTKVMEQLPQTIEDNGRKRNYPFVAPEALELNSQIVQKPASNGANTMFQLPPGIIADVITSTHENSKYTPMKESLSVAPALNQSLNQSVSQESFKSLNTSFSMNSINDDSLNLFQSIADTNTSWDSKDCSMFQKCGSNDDLGFPSLDFNSHDVFASHPMDTTDNSIKISSPTSVGFLSEHFGIQSRPGQSVSNTSVVSQFLQNISMGMKSSDPMLSQQQTVMSSKTMSVSDTITTPAYSKLLMTTNTRHTPVSTQCNSILKEVLTCSPASLNGLSFPSRAVLHTSSPRPTALRQETEMELDSALKSLFMSDLDSKSNCSLGFSALKANTIDLTQSNPGSPLHGMPFTPDHTLPGSHSDMPFSPSDVLTLVSQDQQKKVQQEHESQEGFRDLNRDLIESLMQQRLQQQQQPHQQQQHLQQQGQQKQSEVMEQQAGPSGTPQQEDSFMPHLSDLSALALTPHQHQIMSTHPQQVASPSQLQQQYIDDIVTSQSLQTPSQVQHALVPSLINHLLSPRLAASPSPMAQVPSPAPQFHGQQQQQQSSAGSPLPIAPAPSPGQQYHGNATYLHQQQQQQQISLPMVEQACYSQQSAGLLAGGPQNNSSTMPQANNSTLATTNTPAQNGTMIVPTNGPQIIIYNNPNQMSLGAPGMQGQFGAQPSIVIVPGQGGSNNQMENLLRSILESMMQPQQQSQQQQPPL
ncbi:nuclear factor of activated T-cells 5-like isoform X2 [Dreissena polymorpha]|uniref:nuclear factor of activated T-cells 5-like isoform X2 n=1 Tax=Dreissena polymorpha TaxID=45954 RepID=UPI0022643021|nr:nuclear factor of activated T-cells 5-like isoform X2 [Dreissena polymorpha]